MKTKMGSFESKGVARLEKKFSTPDWPPSYSARGYADGTERTTMFHSTEQLWRVVHGEWHRIK